MTGDISTWFNSVDRLVDILISGAVIYLMIIALVRVSGKRTTSQMNNFDWIITVALGGIVTSAILLENVSIADAIVAAVWLVFLQWVTTSLVQRSAIVANIIKAEPTLLVDNGKLLENNMKRERISESEIYSALRANGLHELDQAKWIILETDSSFSVIAENDDRPEEPQILENVGGMS